MTRRLLLDANLSLLTRDYLVNTFGFDVMTLQSEGLGHLRDDEVVELARRESRVIVTLDLDFGEIYHRRLHGSIGVIILRLQDQTVESVNRTLGRFFLHHGESLDLSHALIVLDERRVRVISEPPS